MLYAKVDMPSYHRQDFFYTGRLRVYPLVYQPKGSFENPRVAPCSPCYHYSIAAGFFKHGGRILRRKNITAADNRYAQSFFDLRYYSPVGGAAVKLFPCSSMHRNGGGAVLLGNAGYLHCVYAVLIPSLSYFHG